MTTALWLLAIQGLIGAFDTLYFHEWRARLPAMPWQTLVYDNGLGSVRGQLDAMAPVVLVATHGIPDVPSFMQLGYPELDIRFWQAMFAPAATPKPILEKLNAALRAALAEPKVVRGFAQTDLSVFPVEEQTIAAANSLLRAEILRWGQVVRANNIQGAQ